jgi:Fe2+ transport system protein FeoA
MGVVPGTEVEVVRVAPLGDPVALLIRGYHLSLRKEEAREILVEKA